MRGCRELARPSLPRACASRRRRGSQRIVAAARRPRQGGSARRDRGVGPRARLLHVAVADTFSQRTPAESFVGWRDLAEKVEPSGRIRARAGSRLATTGSPENWPFMVPDRNGSSRSTNGERYLFDSVGPEHHRDRPRFWCSRKERSDLTNSVAASTRSSRSPISSGSDPTGRLAVYGVWLANGARTDILDQGLPMIEAPFAAPCGGRLVWTSLSQVAEKRISGPWQRHRAAAGMKEVIR